ncbi:hypothetical protein ACTOJ1_005448 [Shigella flexneri]
MNNICEKFNYPYPENSMYVLYFLKRDGSIVYEIVISGDGNGITDYIENKESCKMYKYLGYVNYKNINSVKINKASNKFLRIINQKENLENIEDVLKMKNINQGQIIDISNINHIREELNRAMNGRKCEREPVYIYSEYEINESLAE